MSCCSGCCASRVLLCCSESVHSLCLRGYGVGSGCLGSHRLAVGVSSRGRGVGNSVRCVLCQSLPLCIAHMRVCLFVVSYALGVVCG